MVSNPKETRRLSAARAETVRAALLGWFAKNRRDLPWRRSPSPYQVWVSEVMLQQTRVSVVVDYYTRFLARFPTLEALAVAEEEEVLGLWQGLGYYSRGRRLLEGARYVVREFSGRLPRSPEELLRVPGIGPYSAGAIASIAHGERAPLVDGNVIRVLCRLFALEGDPTKRENVKLHWQLADELVSPSAPGDFNQALMELGALLCTPTRPSCLVCPLRGECAAFRAGNPERFPEKVAKDPPTEARVLVLLLEHGGRIAFERLPREARWWAGMTALPSIEVGSATGGALSRFWSEHQDGSAASDPVEEEGLVRRLLDRASGGRIRVESVEEVAELRHQVTRFRVALRPFRVRLGGARPEFAEHVWSSKDEVDALPLPAPHRKLLRSLASAPRSRRS